MFGTETNNKPNSIDDKSKRKVQRIKGIDYVYLDTPFWNSAKSRGEHKRKYIGKMVNGTFIPNRTYKLELELKKQIDNTKIEPAPTETCLRKFYGATFLLDQICNILGITADLQEAFGDISKEILSLVYYLVLEEGKALYRFPKWGKTHIHPCDNNITSQRSSQIFANITEDAKMKFLKHQAKRHKSRGYWIFDTTSISSYSSLIKQVKYGKNKEGDCLPQLNLALLYGEKEMLPVYYRKLPGNITDVMIIANLLKDIDYLTIDKLKFVFDRGFYSEKNINNMMKNHHKFLCGAKLSINLVSKCLDEIRSEFVTHANYNSEIEHYVQSFTKKWEYTEEKPRTKEIISESRRVYLHIYYNDQKATDEKLKFNRCLDEMKKNIVNKTFTEDEKKKYLKYFSIHETPVRGVKYTFKEDAIRNKQKNFGYFALLSNDIKDPIQALQIYRNKDLGEKAFNNLKERLDMRRMSVSSEENFEGKLFVQFVALEILSYIKNKMDQHNLFKNYTIQSLLDEFDIIEYYQQPGRNHHLSELTSKQRNLYELLGVSIPA